jgi:hypothetical protein
MVRFAVRYDGVGSLLWLIVDGKVTVANIVRNRKAERRERGDCRETKGASESKGYESGGN